MFYLILVSVRDTGTVILEFFLAPCVSLHSGNTSRNIALLIN